MPTPRKTTESNLTGTAGYESPPPLNLGDKVPQSFSTLQLTISDIATQNINNASNNINTNTQVRHATISLPRVPTPPKPIIGITVPTTSSPVFKIPANTGTTPMGVNQRSSPVKPRAISGGNTNASMCAGDVIDTTKPVFNAAWYLNRVKTQQWAEPMIRVVEGNELKDSIRDQGFDRPLLVNNKRGTGLIVPAKDFGINNIAELLGNDYPIEAIDVETQ